MTVAIAHGFAATISTFQAGLSPTKLEDIPAYMRGFVEKGEISGAVTLVARNGAVASLESVGMADLAARRPMRPDSLFWIASMTKPITATAVLMLQDAGKLSIEDPVEKYLPEFKDQWMIAEKRGDGMSLARPPRPVTIRDLLTHTSGLGDVQPPRYDCSLAELVMAYARQPLNFPPGSQWSYSNSGMNTLGRIVEVVSGEKFENFLQTRLFIPLRMRNTTFWPQGDQLKKLAKAYQLFSKRIKQEIEEGFTNIFGKGFALSVTIGIASYPRDGKNARDLILSADRALLGAKKMKHTTSIGCARPVAA